MTDQEYVVQAFARHFANLTGKKIVLYGVGINTKAILEAFPEAPVLGLMDKTRVGREFYGKQVLSFDEVAAIRPDFIVVVARSGSARLIYYRLRRFCQMHCIALYGINGQDLFELFDYAGPAMECTYFSLTEKSLWEAVEQEEQICFAVEDVLFARKTWSEDDFFALLGEDDIVSRYCELVLPRKKMLEILSAAYYKGKRVLLFYQGQLSKEQLQQVLQYFSVRDYHEILTDPSSQGDFLYVGGDLVKPLWSSRYFPIKSVQEMGVISSYHGLEKYFSNRNDRSLAGCFLATVFNDPFVLAGTLGKRRVDTAYELGRFFLGPLSAAFVLWMIGRIRENGYDGILFGARDGYLMQQLYRRAITALRYVDLPQDWYFQTSRMLCWKATMETPEDMKRIWNELVAKAPELALEKLFGLSKAEIKTYSVELYDEDAWKYFFSYRERLMEVADETRRNYKKYIKKFNFRAGQRYAFFDFVSRGACQHWLGKLLPCKLEGLYVCRHHRYDDPEPETETITGYMEEFQNYMPNTFLFAHLGDAEFVFTSPEASVYGMDKDGKPICYEESRSADELKYVADNQQGILDFLESYLCVYCPAEGDISPGLADRLYRFISPDFTDEQCREKDGLMRDDGLCLSRSLWSANPQSTRR